MTVPIDASQCPWYLSRGPIRRLLFPLGAWQPAVPSRKSLRHNRCHEFGGLARILLTVRQMRGENFVTVLAYIVPVVTNHQCLRGAHALDRGAIV